ncbi:hypothetical protein Tco_0936596 [Tanacetum coccineum]|uniref:Uncharacterized protein n=1 Tax=Tanacetum coccineum TaxID=301880 RepID=A0ABQ5DBV5_9ASTR
MPSYPHDPSKPLTIEYLIPEVVQVIPFDHSSQRPRILMVVAQAKNIQLIRRLRQSNTCISNGLKNCPQIECGVQVPVCYDKHALNWEFSHWGENDHNSNGFAVNKESARDITVCRDDDKLHKFKEGDFKRLRIQDIEDMLLLLVQGKLTNLTVEERIAFNVSLRMFTRSIVIQRRVKDLQLGVESYQKKLNLTKPKYV